jgi:hypothetical protein
LAERLVALRRQLGALEDDQREALKVVSSNGHGAAIDDARSKEFADALEEFEQCVRDLGELGVQIKDPQTGLLDFPATRDGEDVLLCWRLGEESVEYWHDLTSGFAGRRQIDWGEE